MSASQPSSWKMIGAHPLTTTLLAGLFVVVGAFVGATANQWFQAEEGESELPALKVEVEQLRSARDRLVQRNADLERLVADFIRVSHSEGLVIPNGAFIGIIEKSFIAAVNEIRSGIATLEIKDMSGVTETHFVRTGSFINLRSEGRGCILLVGEIDANGVSIKTECKNPSDMSDPYSQKRQ